MENGKNLLKYFDIKNKNIVHNTIACPFIVRQAAMEDV